jgi:SAM-dependent methyltransferase
VNGVALTFTAHNIVLPDGSQTLPGREPIADGGVCQAALRQLELAFPGVPRESVRVADLGCLEGGYAVAFAQAGYDVTGFEVRTENILCCRWAQDQVELENLRFVQADVRDIFHGADEWDAVFCCGLLYHLDDPAAFLRQLGRAVRKLLIVQTHYSTRPDAEHEGYQGHWYDENTAGRWASWKNGKSFWLTRDDLMTAMRAAGFSQVSEQPDAASDKITDPDKRSTFVGLKAAGGV